MSSQEHKQKIWNFIKDTKTAMLTSEDENGDLHARPMHLVQDDYDGTIWFFTHYHSEKVDEIQSDRKVSLAFINQDKKIYVSLSGKANVTQNRQLIDKFWNPVVSAWFPNGKDNDDVALLEIKIHKGEHWNADDNPVHFFYEIAKANVKDEYPDVGKNEKFG
jgi:general stress protein 26